jgi:hypothetical protein
LVGCVDAATGAIVWTVNVQEKFRGDGYGFGFAATPLVRDGKVIVPVGGPKAGLVALHADDGRTVWTAADDPASYCGALPIRFHGREYIVGYLQNALVIVDAATGKVVSRQALSSGYDEHSAWPIYQEPHLLLTGPFRAAAVRWKLQPGPNGAVQCRPDWTSRELGNDILSSVLYQGHIYGFDLRQLQASKHRASRGAFKCLEWASGKVRWSTDRVGHASVLAADRKLFLFNDTGSLILARADPASYQELGRTQLFEDEMCWTPPLLWHGRLFVRSPSRAVCLYVGRPEDTPALPDATTAPSRRSWRLDSAWLVSREREYPNDAPTWEELTLWFAACLLLAFGGAALAGGLVRITVKYAGGRAPSFPLLFWPAAFILGFLGPNLFSSLCDRLLFTWPACLYAALHGVLRICCWAEQHPARRRAGWTARLAIAAFLAVCYGYFELCKSAGMFVTWSFLIGFLPAFPAWLSARAEMKGQRLPVRAAWLLLAFSVFFWSFAGVMLWKGR